MKGFPDTLSWTPERQVARCPCCRSQALYWPDEKNGPGWLPSGEKKIKIYTPEFHIDTNNGKYLKIQKEIYTFFPNHRFFLSFVCQNSGVYTVNSVSYHVSNIHLLWDSLVWLLSRMVTTNGMIKLCLSFWFKKRNTHCVNSVTTRWKENSCHYSVGSICPSYFKHNISSMFQHSVHDSVHSKKYVVVVPCSTWWL